MTTFGDALKAFAKETEARVDALFDNVVEAARSSIVDGSPITGAPGQPVDEGDLVKSWRVERQGRNARIVSDSPYGSVIEDGTRSGRNRPARKGGRRQRIRTRSSRGGSHSVKMTVAGFDRLVEDEVRKLTAADA